MFLSCRSGSLFSLADKHQVIFGIEAFCRARALSRKIFASETPVVRGQFIDFAQVYRKLIKREGSHHLKLAVAHLLALALALALMLLFRSRSRYLQGYHCVVS